jgi:hypothetical protein
VGASGHQGLAGPTRLVRPPILFDEMRADLAGKGLPERYWPTDAQLERAAALLRKALDSCATGNYGRRPEKSHSNAGPNCSRAERASVA